MASYTITKSVKIQSDEDWQYELTADEYGTVEVTYEGGMESMVGKMKPIHIPKDCISHFVNALQSFQ